MVRTARFQSPFTICPESPAVPRRVLYTSPSKLEEEEDLKQGERTSDGCEQGFVGWQAQTACRRSGAAISGLRTIHTGLVTARGSYGYVSSRYGGDRLADVGTRLLPGRTAYRPKEPGDRQTPSSRSDNWRPFPAAIIRRAHLSSEACLEWRRLRALVGRCPRKVRSLPTRYQTWARWSWGIPCKMHVMWPARVNTRCTWSW